MRQVKTGEMSMLESRIKEVTNRARNSQDEIAVLLKDVRDDAEAFKNSNFKELVSPLTLCTISIILSYVIFHFTCIRYQEVIHTSGENHLAELSKLELQSFMSVYELLKLRLRVQIAQREEVELIHRLISDKKYFSLKVEKIKNQVFCI